MRILLITSFQTKYECYNIELKFSSNLGKILAHPSQDSKCMYVQVIADLNLCQAFPRIMNTLILPRLLGIFYRSHLPYLDFGG